MAYRGILTFDYGTRVHGGENQQNRMQTALLAMGWRYTDTTAFVFEQSDEGDEAALSNIWQGVAIVARGSAAIGPITALSFVIQIVKPEEQHRDRFGAHDPGIARDDLRTRVFPGDTKPGNFSLC